MKINRIGKNLTVVLTDGTLLTSSICDDTMYETVIYAKNEEKIRELLTPKLVEIEKEVEEKKGYFERFESSDVLDVFGNSVYLKSVSELTLPQDLAEAIIEAEEKGDRGLLTTYINFWTLCCLNPDSRARTNLFWFLNRYGMTISKSGLFIAYRNVNIKHKGTKIDEVLTQGISDEYTRIKFKSKKAPKNYTVYYDNDEDERNYRAIETKRISTPKFQEKNNVVVGKLDELYAGLGEVKKETTVYTDAHTGTMEIVIGKPVTLPREKCDARQDQTCSSGLHVAGKKWLGNGGFGKTSLLCLVNPADVVAVPPSDNYGKMRTCCYYPVKVIGQSSNLQESIEEYPNGFEDDFMNLIAYDGQGSTEESFDYTLDIPEIPEISRSKIIGRLGRISKDLKKVID